MTDFLDQLEAELHDAAERRGRPRRRRPSALKAVVAATVLALLVVGAARVVDRDAAERPAATPTPPALPPTVGKMRITVATSGDLEFLDLLTARLAGFIGLVPAPDGRPPTADASLGSVVLHKPGEEFDAGLAAQLTGINRIEPLTPAAEERIDFSLRDTDVVVVLSRADQERMLRDPRTCSDAGSLAGGPLSLCVARADAQRFTSFVLGDRPLPVDPLAERAGYWEWAAASPDGETILAQWTGRCDEARAAVISAAGGRPRPLTDGPSRALGWTTDGRAIVIQPPELGCDHAEPGVSLVALAGESTLFAPERSGGLEPSVEPRTVEEVRQALDKG